MSVTADRLQQLISPILESEGYEFYGCVFHTAESRSTLTVYIDRPTGVNANDCARISRQVGALLDVEDPIRGRYNLEVSSPGLDRPLFQLAHYERVVGKEIKVRLRQTQEERRNLKGVLKAVEEDKIKLLLETGDEMNLEFAEIEKAKVISDI